MKHEKHAAQFCAAIKRLSEKPENLSTLECYLSHHFATWLEKFANTPEGIAAELDAFAN